MRLTEQQIEAVRHPESALVEACPGSGKTRTITAKLMHLLDTSGNTPRTIACITYTNAAVHEIERRIRTYGFSPDGSRCQVATIHSFCLRNIFGPYYWKLPQYTEGYELLPPDTERFLEIAESVYSQYHSDFNRDVQAAFRGLRREHNGSLVVKSPLNDEIASKFLSLERNQLVTDFNGLRLLYHPLLETTRRSQQPCCQV